MFVQTQTEQAQLLLEAGKHQAAYNLLKEARKNCTRFKLSKEKIETYYTMIGMLLRASFEIKDYTGCKEIGKDIYAQYLVEDYRYFSPELDVAIKKNLTICENKIIEPYPIIPEKCSVKGYEEFFEIPTSWKIRGVNAVCLRFYEPQMNEIAMEADIVEVTGLKHFPYVEVLYTNSVPFNRHGKEESVAYEVTKLFFKDVRSNKVEWIMTNNPSLYGGELCGEYNEIRFGRKFGKIYAKGGGQYCWSGSASFEFFLTGRLDFPFSFNVEQDYIHAYK